MFTFELVTLSGVKFVEEVYQVNLPTESGHIGVFPHHMPLVSLIEPGIIAVRKRQSDPDKDMELFAVHGGIIEIDTKRLRVLVDEADRSDEVVVQEAEAALASAKKHAADAPDDKSLKEALSQISLQQSRLKIAELQGRHRTQKRR